MSRKILYSYWYKKGYHIDQYGNVVLDEKDYTDESKKKSLPPGSSIRDPEVIPPQETDPGELRENTELIEESPVKFRESKTGDLVEPEDLQIGILYLTPDAQLFTYDGSNMIIYSKIMPREMISQYKMIPVYTILSNINNELMNIVFLTTEEEQPPTVIAIEDLPNNKISPAISYYIRPLSIPLTPIKKVQSHNNILIVTSQDGKTLITYKGLAQFKKKTGTYHIAGPVWPKTLVEEQLIPVSKVKQRISLSNYLRKFT